MAICATKPFMPRRRLPLFPDMPGSAPKILPELPQIMPEQIISFLTTYNHTP